MQALQHFRRAPSLCKKRVKIGLMAHKILRGPGAGFPTRALEELSPEERRLERLEELELETFGWTLPERLEAKPNMQRFATRAVCNVVEETAETGLAEVMG